MIGMSSDAVSPINIQWVVDGVSGTSVTGYDSPLASNRYRAILPAQALQDLGHEVTFVPLSHWDPFSQTIGSADVVVVGKVAPGGDQRRVDQLCERVLAGVQAARQAGLPVVADVNDDHFDRPGVGAYWRELVQRCSLVVVGSATMRDRVAGLTPRPVVVIGDPVASPSASAKVPPRASTPWWQRWTGRRRPVLQLVWYGNLVNWKPMQRWLDRLVALASEHPWYLSVITSPDPALAALIEQFNVRSGADATVELLHWSEEVQWSRVAGADAVLLPSDAGESDKVVKTANRLTDALHAGRFVVASPLPSYLPYADHVALTDDPVAALREFVAAPQAWLSRIEQGSKRVAQELSPLAIGELWHEAIARAVQLAEHVRSTAGTVSTVVPGLEAAEPLRLNLGCGDKILPGFVNVDVVAARAGKSPDVICDLHQLHPFQDNSVDEVMAIHVVEHFWRWEIEDILREWLRVLKPGGRMILECPNLLSACQELLADPVQKARADGAGQRSMWVFYGDPAWRDPLMIHRWGYTPQSLSELMRSVGLMEIRQEPAQYKLREPRDMRLVGTKPASP